MQFKRHLTVIVLAVSTIAFVGCTTPTRYGRSTGEYIDDKTVTSNVKSALNRDTLTDGSQIQVNTFRGNVHLTGFVQHPVQKQQAEQIVRRVNGVQYFKNDIIIMNQLPTMQARERASMNEPSGAEADRSQQFQGSTSSQDSTSSGWQRGNSTAFGPRDQVNEPSGAETEVEVKTNRANQKGSKVESEVERD